ncbi:MAG: LysM peptidoglycan-binding domain-containing protein [Ardenticatenales bacterium]|nr:LysM peptidoglycan-binding domain-containing protein [Ardenticatenales bacterium]
MRKSAIRFLSLVSLTALLLPAGTQPAAWAQESANLLRNPGFEGSYTPWSGINEIQVASDWTPWWVERQPGDPGGINHRPEYKEAAGWLFPDRVHSGSSAQQWFTFYSTHTAGMYQKVFGIQPGARLQFSIWAQVWSSSEDDPGQSVEPGQINLQIGLDPTGNTDPWASTVAWSPIHNQYDTWLQVAIEASAQTDAVTVFMKSAPLFPVKHNDTYWDDAVLIAIEASPPTAQPSPTPGTEPTQAAATAPPTEAASATPPPLETASATVSPTTTPTSAPTATCAPPPAGWTPYTVLAGDYLTALSRTYGTSVAEIIAANCLEITMIYVGQTLLLPAPPIETSSPSPVPTAANTEAPSPAPTATTRSPAPTATTRSPAPTVTPLIVLAPTVTSTEPITPASPTPPTPAAPAATTTPVPPPAPAPPGRAGIMFGVALALAVPAIALALLARKRSIGRKE